MFGSVARDEATDESDVDILVEFKGDAIVGMFEFIDLQRFLAHLLDRKIDLATSASLHKALKDDILREAVRAA